jgi:c-di-GMP-binding flagellar brake protein YcgR
MAEVRVGEWSGAENRKHRRVPLNVPIDCRGARDAVHGQTSNISVSGLLVRCPTIFPQDDEIEVTFTLPGSRNLIRTRARVAHVVPDAFIGVEFIDPSPESKQEIEQYVAATPVPPLRPKEEKKRVPFR